MEFCFHSIRDHIDRISPNFIFALLLTRSRLGLLHIIFVLFETELWPLIYVRIVFLLIYLENKWPEFDQTLYTHYIDKI